MLELTHVVTAKFILHTFLSNIEKVTSRPIILGHCRNKIIGGTVHMPPCPSEVYAYQCSVQTHSINFFTVYEGDVKIHITI